MAQTYMERIQALHKQYLDTRVDMDVYNAKYLTEGFKATEGQPWIIQKVTGLLHQCRKKNIYIQDNELLVGGAGFKPRCGILCANSSCSILDRGLSTIGTRKFDPFYLSEEGKKVFQEEVPDYWKNKCVLDRWRAPAPEDMGTLRDNGMIYIDRKAVRGYGETTPGWDHLLILGISGTRKEAEEALTKLDDSHVGDLEKTLFLKSEIIVCEGIIALVNRHADLAGKTAAGRADLVRKAEPERIAAVCRRAPEYPASSFYEAVQNVLSYKYAIYMEQNASPYNLGHIDQYLYPYYRADTGKGVITREEAQELLNCLWIKIAELSLFQDKVTAQYAAGYRITANVTAGDIDQFGNDAANELSYMAIQATTNVQFKEPNLSICYNTSKNPDALLRKAVESIRTGLTMPAIHHDDAGVRILLNKGVPLSEAWDWNPCGCVETNLSGRMRQCTDMADVNLGGIIEMTLNDGVSRKTGKRVSISIGDLVNFKTFDNFFDTVKAHVRYFVDAIASGNQLLDYLSMNYHPVPCLPLTYPHCIESANDYSTDGAKYNCGGGVITIGQADIISSLAAVRNLIYDKKKLTVQQLCNALAASFKGYEDVQRLCMEAPKYGNDDERADWIVSEVFVYIINQFETYDTKFGKMTCGMLPVPGNTPIGEWVGALPSGRYTWTPLIDGVGATGGTDTNGPTALLKSASHIPHARSMQGAQFNMKMEPGILADEKGLTHMIHLLKTLCTLDVYHAQFNVINRKILLAAQEHPEQHRDLLIRVTSYIAFFIESGREVQDEIISRTLIRSW